MSKKKGLSGTYDLRALTGDHQRKLNLEDGFLYKSWDARDPRLYEPIKCIWFPMVSGDSQFSLGTWKANIPFDYGRESGSGRPAGYSFYAEDGYNFGDYYEYPDPHEPGKKRRVRLALFGNEMDLESIDGPQGFPESAGVPPRIAAGVFYTLMQLWPYVHWVAPTCSQHDFIVKGYYDKKGKLIRDSKRGKYAPYLREFIDELWIYWQHVHDNIRTVERILPWPQLVHISFNLYPKGFNIIPDSMKQMCELSWYLDLVQEVLRTTGNGLGSATRERVWILEYNSRPAQWGPDFPKPPQWPADKADWPGIKRLEKWMRDMESDPRVVYHCGFIGTHPLYDHYAFLINDQLSPTGKVFASF